MTGLRSWRYRLRRLAELDVFELRLLAAAQLHLVRAKLAVRNRPLGDLVGIAATAGDDVVVSAPPGDDEMVPESALQITRAMERAARHGLFRPTCLVRALALRELLITRGHVGSEIRVGVRKDAGMFAAHAWVELCGVALGEDASSLRRYVRMSEARLAEIQ